MHPPRRYNAVGTRHTVHGGHHHLPIVDLEDRLVGVITQTDLVRTLAVAVQGHDGE